MEEFYANVEDEESKVSFRPSTPHTGPSSSESRSHGAVVLSLGLLSVFLLAGLVGLGVHYHNSVRGSAADLSTMKDNLTERLRSTEDKMNSVSEALDRLQRWCKQNKACPAGWKTHRSSCYLLSTRSDSWEKSREDCRDKGADLVIIDSLEEQQFLSSFIKQTTWIGLNDRDDEGTWKWIDGTPLTQAFWGDYKTVQPDNGGGNPQWGEEDCAGMENEWKADRNWNDVRCDNSLHWICENLA